MARQKKEDQTTVVETPVVVEEQAPVATPEVPEAPAPVLLSTGKWAYGPTATINCEDCGAERIIKIQDLFQVTRCAACQKKAQNKKRAQKKKARNQEASRTRRLEEARKLLMEAGELPKAQD